jgi:hypothetical protein
VGRAVTGSRWWQALPAVETWVPCGDGTHPVRWADGTLSLPAHPDSEGEAVLAALGGDKAACLEVAEAWQRHTSDLDWFMTGPRDPDDEVEVRWDYVQQFRAAPLGGWVSRQALGGPIGSRPMIQAQGTSKFAPGGAGGPARASRQAGTRRAGRQEELERLRARQVEMLMMLALGPAFQLALSGTIAASWASGGPRAAELEAGWPMLEPALAGRLAPAAATWLGIDPDRVDATLLERAPEPAGWGALELTGTGTDRWLHATLPVSWLASVWAPGLAVVAGHLVVAVEQAAWPDATVLAVPAPGRPPVRLEVQAIEGEVGTNVGAPGRCTQWAHWEITERAGDAT